MVLFESGFTADHALVVDTGVIGAWTVDAGQPHTRTVPSHRVSALTDEQGVRWHRSAPDALVTAGRDVEARVLARAVGWHAESRVLLHGDRTVVFS